MAEPLNVYGREYVASLTAPAKRMALINPNDANDLSSIIKAIRVLNLSEAACNLTVKLVSGDQVTLVFPPGLYREDIQIRRVMRTNTTIDDSVIFHGYFDQ